MALGKFGLAKIVRKIRKKLMLEKISTKTYIFVTVVNNLTKSKKLGCIQTNTNINHFILDTGTQMLGQTVKT